MNGMLQGNWRRELGVPILVGGLALALRLAAGPWPVDDAYITFRYARNLAGVA